MTLAIESDLLPIKPLRFMGISVLSFVLIVWLPESVFAPLNHATAYLAGLCLPIFGEHPATTGEIISLNGFPVRIIAECTALNSIVLFAAFVFSVPASPKARLAGLLAGVPFLVTANTLRIALITMTGAHYPALFEPAHVYLAQVVMIILVVASSFLWLRLATGSGEINVPFLLRAFGAASIIFLPWLILNRTYVKALDRLTTGIFALAGYPLTFTYGHLVYFQTFNTVLFLALMLAEKRLSIRRRAAWAAGGGAALAAAHLLFRVGNVLLAAFSWQPALKLTVALSVIGEYLLPLLLWFSATSGFRGTASAKAGRWKSRPNGSHIPAALLPFILLCFSGSGHAASIRVIAAGDVNFTVQGADLLPMTALDITLHYDTSAFFNPIIDRGGYLRGGATLSSSAEEGGIITLSVREGNKPLSGSGVIATIMFARLADWPGGIDSGTATLTVADGGTVSVPVVVSAPERSGEKKSPDAKEGQSGGKLPAGTGDLKVITRLGALDRYLLNRGKPVPEALDAVFSAAQDPEVIQAPPVALSDGHGTVTLTVPVSTCPNPRAFALEGAEVLSAEPRGDAGWVLAVVPRRGGCRAGLSILCDNTITVHPLTLAPPLEEFQGNPVPGGADSCPGEYVAAANRLARDGMRVP